MSGYAPFERNPRQSGDAAGSVLLSKQHDRDDSSRTLSVISLFAGIGGFDLGCAQAGMRVVAHVEKDDHCRKLLASKFPAADVLDDVCTSGANNLPPCDVLAGGWPCQDLSVAGKRAGLAGARSGLFYQFTRIAYELQPAIILWENVPGLLNSDDGRDMLRVVEEFQRIGYSGGWRTLDAQFLGVAQRRRRVFGVFALANLGAACCAEILSLYEGVRGYPAPRREARQDVAGTLGGSSQSGGFRTTDLDNNGAFICGTLTPGAHPGSYNGQDAYTGHLIAFSSKDSGADAGALAPTLRSMNYKDSHINGGGQVAIAFKPSHYTRDKDGAPSEIMPLLSADADKGDQETIVFQTRIARNGRGQPDTICPALNGSDAGATSDMRPIMAIRTAQTGSNGWGINMDGLAYTQDSAQQAICSGSAVRRLTPRECERLQGFPDDWTAGFNDSTRYRMLGNAVAVPVARWIAVRIVATLAGLPGSFLGSAKADERATTKHNGAQEHNERVHRAGVGDSEQHQHE